MRKSKSGKNNNEHDELELNNDLSDVEKGITEMSKYYLKRVISCSLNQDRRKKLVLKPVVC